MAMGEGQPAMDPWGRGRGKGKIEHGDRRDLAAGSDTTTTVGSAEDSGRERRVGRQPRGVAAWGGGITSGSAKEKIRDQISFSMFSPETGSHL
jgi:hypothetical protein